MQLRAFVINLRDCRDVEMCCIEKSCEYVSKGIGGEAEAVYHEADGRTAAGVESSCTTVRSKRLRRMLVKLKGGKTPFQIEKGRWQGVERERRICK